MPSLLSKRIQDKHITTDMKTKFSDLINGEQAVLIDFFAEWCSHCKRQTGELFEVVEHFKDKIRIAKVDIDINKTLAHKYKIHSVPTLFLFKDGELLWIKKGVATKNELVSLLDMV